MKLLSWPLTGLVMVGMAVLILSAPAEYEGPVLVPISPGHALSVLDTIALLPLLAGTIFLYWGIWQRRGRLLQRLAEAPGIGASVVFVAGLGLGLLIASSFSTFWWWWAIGATLFAAMLMVALAALGPDKM